MTVKHLRSLVLRAAAILACGVWPAAIVSGQGDPAADAARVAKAQARLAPLAGLIGQWSGDARTMGPTGAMVIAQHEDIVWGAERTVMFIRGTGRSTEGANKGEVVFEAAALLWVDPETGTIKMRTHRGGMTVEPTVEVKPDTLTWSFAAGGGRVRYVIAFSGDAWHEVGHYLREGAAPIQIIDMRLRRLAR